MLYLCSVVLDDQMAQGNVVRNVAKLVDRVAGDARAFRTLTDAEMFRILDHNAATGTCGYWRSMGYGVASSRACVGSTST
jgi:hypothetical protein